MSWWRMALGPAAVTIRTDIDLTAATRTQEARPRADLYRLEALTEGNPDLPTVNVQLVEGAGPAMTIDPGTNTVQLRASRGDLALHDLLYLAYVVLESRLHRQGVVTLHAAAVERDGQAVILLGHSGAGKTTTALRLCRDHGFGLLGNDLVVVGGADDTRVHAGTCNLRLRQSSVVASMSELSGLFASASIDPWRAKIDVWPEHIGVTMGLEGSLVGLVVFIHADPSYDEVVDCDGDTLVHRLNLYENSLRYIRASSTPWLIGETRDFGPYVPSLDSPIAHQARTMTLQRLLAMSRYVAGPPDRVATSIAQRLRTPTAATPGGMS